MAKWIIKSESRAITMNIEGDFWPGCGPQEWSISDAAMESLLTGLMTHHDRVLNDLKLWHTHALSATHSVAAADFGRAIGQVMCAADAENSGARKDQP